MSLQDDEDSGLPQSEAVNWDIRRSGRAWGSEAMDRFQLTPEKFEVHEGKLFWSERERLLLLGLLLENVGADAAVKLGDPEIWKAAIDALGTS